MNVTLTGSTGFIGSHILTELQEHGHEVTALVRDDAQADRVAAIGATPAVVDLYDRPAVTSKFSSADGAIHTASPGDATSANLDSEVAARRPTLSRAPASPISTSAATGFTGTIPPSPRSLRSTHLRWWHGRSRSNAGCSTRQACAES
jgi:uncharacterized protein YbjT (DUF2867 family)